MAAVAFAVALSLLGATTSRDEPETHVPVPASLISLDPTSVQDQSSLWVARHVHCQLVRLKQGKVVPEAVESYRYLSPTSIEMTLGTQYRFHDGSPITAADVRATFEYLRASRNVLRNIFGWLKEVRTPQPDKVVFELARPVPHFLRVLSAPNYALLQRDFLARAVKDPPLWQNPLGCGTYHIGETNSQLVRLLPVAAGQRSIAFHLRSGRGISLDEMRDFDIVSFGLEPKGLAHPDFREERLFDPYHILFGLNTKVAPWGDRQKRCDLFSRLDASTAAAGYGGEAEVATELVPRGALGFSPEVNYPVELRANRAAEPPKKTMRVSFLSVSVPEPRRDGYLAILRNAGVDVSASAIERPKHYAIQFQATSQALRHPVSGNEKRCERCALPWPEVELPRCLRVSPAPVGEGRQLYGVLGCRTAGVHSQEPGNC
jgi:hypothetical protein